MAVKARLYARERVNCVFVCVYARGSDRRRLARVIQDDAAAAICRSGAELESPTSAARATALGTDRLIYYRPLSSASESERCCGGGARLDAAVVVYMTERG